MADQIISDAHYRKQDREQLLALLVALDASDKQLRRDECGDWRIGGRWGHIYARGDGFHLVAFTDECDLEFGDHRSARRWGAAKQRLAFASVLQDGDEEGILHLDGLPSSEQAEEIRVVLGIRKRRHLSDEDLARLRSRMAGLNAPDAL